MKEIQIYKNILTEPSRNLQDFFKDISRFPLISWEEQVELAREAKKGNLQSREKLINSNLRFVVTCAKQYVGQGVPLIDLIQSGIYGLILSIDNYDPDRGYRFISYAVWYIRRELLRAIYNTGRTIRYPVTQISKITRVKKAYEEFLTKHQREPNEEEIIKLADITPKQYKSVIMDKSYCQSLDTPVTSDEKTTIEDTLIEEPKPFTDIFTKETISKALKILNPREYKVVVEYYGLEGNYSRTIKEIAKELGLGDERVRQLRKNAIKKLKNRYGSVLQTLL